MPKGSFLKPSPVWLRFTMLSAPYFEHILGFPSLFLLVGFNNHHLGQLGVGGGDLLRENLGIPSRSHTREAPEPPLGAFGGGTGGCQSLPGCAARGALPGTRRPDGRKFLPRELSGTRCHFGIPVVVIFVHHARFFGARCLGYGHAKLGHKCWQSMVLFRIVCPLGEISNLHWLK